MRTHGIEAALRGALLTALRHDAAGMGPRLEGNRQHLLGGSHFQIER